MKRLTGSLAALFLSCSLIVGCGGGSSTNLAAIRQALLGCSQDSLTRMLQVLYALVGVPDILAGEAGIPGFSVSATLSTDPLDPANTYDFSVVFDTNSNLIPDTAVVGKATFSEDPTDGLSPAATIQFTFTVQNTPVITGASFETGTLTGSGSILATLGLAPEEVTITGSISLTDTAGDGCVAELVFEPLNLVFNDFDEGAVQLAANVGLLELFGTIQAAIESLGHTLDATLTLTQGSQTVEGTGSIDDTAEFDFDFELLPSNAEIQELLECTDAIDLIEVLTDLYVSVLDSGVLNGGTPPPGVIITPTGNPNVFNYTADLVVLDPTTFLTGTLFGQATLTLPVVAGIIPSQVSFTWTLSNGTLSDAPPTTISGNSTRPLRLRLDGAGDLLSTSGAGTINVDRILPLAGIPVALDCTVTFDIPETDPITNDEDDGILIVTVTAGDNVLVLTIDLGEDILTVAINGIPIPFFFF